MLALLAIAALLSPSSGLQQPRRLGTPGCQPWWKCILATLETSAPTPAPVSAGDQERMSLLAHELVGRINVDTERGVQDWRGLHRGVQDQGGSAWEAESNTLSMKEQDEADTLASKMLADLKKDSAAQMVAQLHKLSAQIAATASPTPPPAVSPFAAMLGGSGKLPWSGQVVDTGASLPSDIPGLALPWASAMPWGGSTDGRLRLPTRQPRATPRPAPTPAPLPTKPTWCSLPVAEYNVCIGAKGGCCQGATCIVFGHCRQPSMRGGAAVKLGHNAARAFEKDDLKAPAPEHKPAKDLAKALAKIRQLQLELQQGGS